MTWEQYMPKLQAAGYRHDVAHSWKHKQTGRVIYPHQFGKQPDGTRRTNWSYWAECDVTPPPF